MATSPNRERLFRVGEWLATIGALVGFSALMGQLVGVRELASYIEGRPVLQPIASTQLVVLGVAVLAAARAKESLGARVLSLALGFFSVSFAVVVASEYILQTDFGVDQLVGPTIDDGGPFPGRPSPVSTIAHLMLSAAVIVFDVRVGARGRPREWLLIAVLFAAFVALVGHLFGASALYDVDPYPMRGVAIPAIISLFCIGIGGLLVRSEEGAMRTITSDGPGGLLARRLGMATIVAVPIAAGVLFAGVNYLGVRDLSLIAALGTVTAVGVGLVLVGATAGPLERAHVAEMRARRRVLDMVAYAPVGVFVADLGGTLLEVNEAGARMIGCSPQELIGRPIQGFVPEEEADAMRAARSRQLAGEVEVHVWHARRKDGTFVPLEFTEKILPDRRWQGFAVDITHRLMLSERVERALAVQEFLANAGVELASQLDLGETLEAICQLATEGIGDVCAVDVIDGNTIRRVAFAHRMAMSEEEKADVAESVVPMGSDHPTAAVLASRGAVVLPESGAELARRMASTPGRLRALERIGLHSGMVVPMVARHQLLAVMCIGRCGSSPRFDEDDVRLAEGFASRAALAFDNVRLYQESRLQAAMITNLAEGIALTRVKDQTIVFTNPRFDEMARCRRNELVGARIVDVVATNHGTPEERVAEIVAELVAHGRWHGELLLRRKDGTTTWQAVSVSTYEHETYGLVWMSAHTDIDERKRLERAAERVLREKEILLKEVHHRVKNNLQVISSLFSLQRGRAESEEVKLLLDESRVRIQSIALVHEQLYRSTDLAAVNFDEYLRGLIAAIRTSFGAERVVIETESNGIELDIEQAVPAALILAELIANALKHAFKGRERGHVLVSARKDAEGRCVVAVADDGIGMSEDFDWRAPRSLGLRIVRDLSRQLRGKASFETGPEGTTFFVRFPLERPSRGADEGTRLEA